VGDADVVGDLHGRLIVFDLDGTLVDSRRDLADSANELIVELGGAPLPEEAIGRMVGEGAALLVRRALTQAGLEDRPGALERFLAIYDRRLLNHTKPYEGIREAIAAGRAHARLAVLTNKPGAATARVLEGLGLRASFDAVIAGDSEWPRKPDPASLLELASRANATPIRTLLVGDSAIDHETALRAGARCCLATYGFGYEMFPAGRLTGSEWVVRAPADLAAVFESFSAA